MSESDYRADGPSGTANINNHPEIDAAASVAEMAGAESLQNAGEHLFEVYCEKHHFAWQREQQFGRKHPDYLVETKVGPVLCEIKDFAEGNLDKAALKGSLTALRPKLPEGDEYTEAIDKELRRLQTIEGRMADVFDPYSRLQEKIDKASKQLRAAKGKLPCVVIIHNPGYFPHERDFFMRQGLGKQLFFNKGKNTTISAVAVIEEHCPNKATLTDQLQARTRELRERIPKGKDRFNREFMVAVLQDVGQLEIDLREQQPAGFFEQSEPFLRVYHNKDAAVPLSKEAFAGPYDEHVCYSDVMDTSKSKLVGTYTISQTDDSTCRHCGALTGVKIVADSEAAQTWRCEHCLAVTNLKKFEDKKIAGWLGQHGPNHSGLGSNLCCGDWRAVELERRERWRQSQIALIAYEHWLVRQCAHGADLADWFLAEESLHAELPAEA